MNNLEPIKLNVIYGEESKTDSLKAYKAESILKKAVIQHKKSLENYFYNQYNIPNNFKLKLPESDEKEEYSLIDLINSKLTNASVSLCLDTFKIYQQKGIEIAIEKLHLQSNLTII
ncbi:MAG: hypothetical protein ACEQSQ_06035 [Candidatus Paceibacteria bacterium]